MADGEQLSLLRGAARRRPARPPDPPVAERTDAPVARVVVDLPLPHLDHPFDYLVPLTMSAAAQPGVRVKVRFAGRDVDAFVTDRLDASDHPGRLSPLRRVVSAEPVLTAQTLRLARAVADRYAGTLSDVLRLALPPRHAATETGGLPGPEPAGPQPIAPQAVAPQAVAPQAVAPQAVASLPPVELPGPWARYPAGAAFLARLAAGEAPRAVWTALPGRHWVDAVVAAVRATVDAGRGAVVVLPDRRDVDLLDAALAQALAPGLHARLEADLGPAARYAAFLACLRGRARVAIGTRAAAFAPISDLGLAVIWDDGDDQHAELRAPYPHVREVLALRAEQQSAAMLVGGWSVTTEAALLVRRGWARPIEADRAVRRAAWPRVVAAADAAHADTDPAAAAARIPSAAWRAVQQGLTAGPVLVQVARAGYAPAVACQDCRRPARCRDCTGPIRLTGSGPGAAADCAWCGRVVVAWTCPHCSGRVLRALRIGAQRTADELGRAFPSARIVLSRPERTLPEVGERPAIVVATPGVEPAAAGGYAAAVLLDAETLLARADLRAGEEALRRWRAAAALVRPAGDGGVVGVCADPSAPAVQALVRGDPAGLAAHELEQRGSLAPGGIGGRLGLPPSVTAASLLGSAESVAGLLAAAQLPPSTQVDGPVPVDDDGRRPSRTVAGSAPAEQVRYVLRVPLTDGAELARALHAAAAVRSARRDPGPVRMQIDPRDLG